MDNQDEEKLEPQHDLLLHRFGSPSYYEDMFRHTITHFDATETFELLEANKSNKSDDRYEAARQEFLKIYGRHKGRWHPTSHLTDRYVDLTKIHITASQEEYLGFLRMQPNGYRGERIVPPYMDIKLHLLMGKVLLTYRKRPRTMVRGCHAHIAPKSTLTIKCISHDQAAVFVIKISVNKKFVDQSNQ